MSSLIPAKITLTSLPEELLIQIALLLDSSSAAALARVAPCCTSPAELSLWRDLNITISSAGVQGKSNEGVLEQGRKNALLRRKVRLCLLRMDESRCGMVESLWVTPRPAALNGIIEILDLISPTLTRLSLGSPRGEGPCDEQEPNLLPAENLPNHLSIDVRLIDSGLSFPFLTHMRIGPNVVRYAGAMFTLCELAPNLSSLDITISESLFNQWTTDFDQALFPLTLPSPNKIRRLRLSIRDCTDDDDDDDIEALADIIHDCTSLEQLSLQFVGRTDDDNGQMIHGAMRQGSSLRDLYCPTPWFRLNNMQWEPNKGYFGALRRLIVRIEEEVELYTAQPNFPTLEVLYLYPSQALSSATTKRAPTPRETTKLYPILPSFSKFLRSCPRLRNIHFLREQVDESSLGFFKHLDDLEISGDMGWVLSIRHGDSELLHAHLLLDHVVAMDIPYFGPIPMSEQGRTMIYTSDGKPGGVPRIRAFRCLGCPDWDDLVDLDLLPVPLEVLEKMRVMEGVKRADWRGRGIEVKDRTWRVLEDWMNGVGADMAAKKVAERDVGAHLASIFDELVEMEDEAEPSSAKSKKKKKKKKKKTTEE